MALRQTYLSMRDKLPAGSEYVLVMRGRGNDELAPSAALLGEFNDWKARFTPDQGHRTAYEFAWDRCQYEKRFREQISGDARAIARLRALAEQARDQDVFLICYEAYDKPCHRKLLLAIAEEQLGAAIDPTPYFPPGADKDRRRHEKDQLRLF